MAVLVAYSLIIHRSFSTLPNFFSISTCSLFGLALFLSLDLYFAVRAPRISIDFSHFSSFRPLDRSGDLVTVELSRFDTPRRGFLRVSCTLFLSLDRPPTNS